MTDRRYNEDEVALILRKAVDAGADDRAGGSGKGMSLSELKEIGSEVGIDASLIENAARALDLRHSAPLTGSVLGMPTTVQLDRIIPVRLERDHLPQLLDVIRHEFARQGIVEEVLGDLEWKARSAMGGRYVSIRSEGDQTRIRVLGNYRDSLMVSTLGMGAILAASIGALAAALGAVGAPVIVPIALAGAAAASLTLWRYAFNREVLTAHRVMDSLERHLLRSASLESASPELASPESASPESVPPDGG